jgi:type VI secretion system lysozyme-like protein
MKLPRVTEGARVLLFDRLDNRALSPAETAGLKILDRDGLRESVRRELFRLLNTRCATPTNLIGGVERSVVNYGIPDFSSMSPSSSEDQKRRAVIIGQTISAFEPRLAQVRVNVDSYLETEHTLFVRIDAMLVVQSITEPVSFKVYLHTSSGALTIEEIEKES